MWLCVFSFFLRRIQFRIEVKVVDLPDITGWRTHFPLSYRISNIKSKRRADDDNNRSDDEKRSRLPGFKWLQNVLVCSYGFCAYALSLSFCVCLFPMCCAQCTRHEHKQEWHQFTKWHSLLFKPIKLFFEEYVYLFAQKTFLFWWKEKKLQAVIVSRWNNFVLLFWSIRACIISLHGVFQMQISNQYYYLLLLLLHSYWGTIRALITSKSDQ